MIFCAYIQNRRKGQLCRYIWLAVPESYVPKSIIKSIIHKILHDLKGISSFSFKTIYLPKISAEILGFDSKCFITAWPTFAPWRPSLTEESTTRTLAGVDMLGERFWKNEICS